MDNPRIKPGTKKNENGKKKKKKDVNIHNIFSDKGDWRHRTRHLRHHSTTEERRRELYPTDAFPNKWSYEARLYVEIDSILVANNGGLTQATTYVNALMTAISAMYEEEVDTHCK